MKKKEITSEENQAAPEAEPSNKRITRPRQYRKKAQEAIGENYTSIVSKLAEEASTGSVQHTKLLFELGDVKGEVKAASSQRRKKKEPSLGKLLMQEAEKHRREQEAKKDEALS